MCTGRGRCNPRPHCGMVWMGAGPSRSSKPGCPRPSAGLIRGVRAGEEPWESHMAGSRELQLSGRRGDAAASRASSLPPEQSNLGSQRSRERPETGGTTDCATLCCSIACTFVASRQAAHIAGCHIASPHAPSPLAQLGVLHDTARGGTDPLRKPLAPSRCQDGRWGCCNIPCTPRR